MSMNDAVKLKIKANAMFASIKSLSTQIRMREHNLCQFKGAKLEIKKREIMILRKLKTEKTQTLKQLNDRIPTMWGA